MTKLLVDASNLSIGGGSTLLAMLVQRLTNRSLSFHAVAPARTGLLESQDVSICQTGNPLGKRRQALIEHHVAKTQSDRVLFFGNIPSPHPLPSVKTFTYFQNAHLVRSLSTGVRQPLKDKIRYGLLQRFVRRTLNHSEHWIFQTRYIRDQFLAEYGSPAGQTHVYPYFDLSYLQDFRTGDTKEPSNRNGFVYLSAGYPHKNHARLIQAWQILKADYNLCPRLHLTVQNLALNRKIDAANANGCQIENHGFLGRKDALELANHCQFTIFPSLLETIGLGLIEGSLLGTKVLCSDSEAFSEVITPSVTFNAMNPAEIASTVANVLANPAATPWPIVRLQSRLDEMIDRIYQ